MWLEEWANSISGCKWNYRDNYTTGHQTLYILFSIVEKWSKYTYRYILYWQFTPKSECILPVWGVLEYIFKSSFY